MPYTKGTSGAWVKYKMQLWDVRDSVDVHLFFAATMPFIPGGHNVKINMDGEPGKLLNLNKDLTWDNKYTLMYPTAAARIIHKKIRLPLQKDSTIHTLVYRPLQPGIVLTKLIVDCGGYEETRLGLLESPYDRE